MHTNWDELLAALPDLVNQNANIRRIGRFCSVEMRLAIGDSTYYLNIDRGCLTRLTPGPLKMARWQFSIAAPEDSWREFWSARPAPGFQDIFAMASTGNAQIEGDIGPMLENLRFIKALIELPAQRLSGGDGHET